jgi:hypothetical protein
MSVHLSTWNNSAPTGWISMKFNIRVFFKNTLRKFRFHYKQDRNKQYFAWRPIYIVHQISLCSSSKEMFQTRAGQKIETYTLRLVMFFWKSCHLRDNVEKCCWARPTTVDNMAHAYCMLDIKGYKYILRICIAYYVPTATMVAWMHLNVALYVHCLSCCVLWRNEAGFFHMFVYFYQTTRCHILEDSRLLIYQQFVLYSAAKKKRRQIPKFHKNKYILSYCTKCVLY